MLLCAASAYCAARNAAHVPAATTACECCVSKNQEGHLGAAPWAVSGGEPEGPPQMRERKPGATGKHASWLPLPPSSESKSLQMNKSPRLNRELM
jgi:hypothetical protein